MPWLSDNGMWEAFGSRTLMHAAYGGADFGECRVTIDRIGEALDREAWAREWTATATTLRDQGRRLRDRRPRRLRARGLLARGDLLPHLLRAVLRAEAQRDADRRLRR